MLTRISNSTQVALEISTVACVTAKRWIFICFYSSELATHWNINISLSFSHHGRELCLMFVLCGFRIANRPIVWYISFLGKLLYVFLLQHQFRWVCGHILSMLSVWLSKGTGHTHNCIHELELLYNIYQA